MARLCAEWLGSEMELNEIENKIHQLADRELQKTG